MTGDGAVVREWEDGWQGPDLIQEHNAAIRQLIRERDGWEELQETESALRVISDNLVLAQAAEIERLTLERDNAKTEVKSWIKVALNFRTAAEASEARTADLLKYIEGRGHADYCPLSDDDSDPEFDETEECTCGLTAAIAAAKGETV